MKIFFIVCMALFISCGFIDLYAHVRFKVEAGSGFENHPEVVSKIEDYFNENIGKQLDHEAVVHLKVFMESNSHLYATYFDRTTFIQECKQGFFNSAIQEAILTGSTVDNKLHGIITFNEEHTSILKNASLSPRIKRILRHEITHGLGIFGSIEVDSSPWKKREKDSSLKKCLIYTPHFEAYLSGNVLEKFCGELVEKIAGRNCSQTHTTFDMYLIDKNGTPLINKSTFIYQGIDLNTTPKDEIEIFFKGKNSKVRLETDNGHSIDHIHTQFPFEYAIMGLGNHTNEEWTHFEVSMLKDLGYKVNVLGIKRAPVYSNCSNLTINNSTDITFRLTDGDGPFEPRVLSGAYGLGHLSDNSHIIIGRFDKTTNQNIPIASIPFKQVVPTQTISIQFDDQFYTLRVSVQHPYHGEDAYYVEFELLRNSSMCIDGVCSRQ